MTHSNDHNYAALSHLKAIESPDATYFSKDPSLVFSRAKGSLIWDLNGKEYIDLCAGFGVLSLGHHPDIFKPVWDEFAHDASPHVMHAMGDVYPGIYKAELMASLLSMLPKHFTRASLALSGSQAVELAMKTAAIATGGAGFICLEGGYHGLDLGSLNVTYRADFRAPFMQLLKPEHVYFCRASTDREIMRSELSAALQYFEEKSIKPAGLLVEPIQGRAGIKVMSVDVLQAMRRSCDETGMALIYDEIFCGLGRTGEYSAAFSVPSDLSCFGKPLGGGLPLSACVGTERMMRSWPENAGEAIHTGTFFGHPLSCRLGLLTLQSLRDLELDKRALAMEAKVKTFLDERLGRHKYFDGVRGRGLMLGIGFNEPGFGARLMDDLRKDGVIILPSGEHALSVSITPALNIPEELLSKALEKLCASAHRLA